MEHESTMSHDLDEESFLDKVRGTYVTSVSQQDRLIRDLVIRTFGPFVKRGRALELGCSDGYMTERIASLVEHLDIAEGSSEFLEQARARGIPNARFIHSLFEDFKSAVRYDYVFATYVLEHVRSVAEVLEMVRSVMQAEGLLFVVVPNCRALSRQLARHMGLIDDLKDLTENDRNHGHRRVYDRVSLDRDLANAGFVNVSQGGILLKFLADFQMDRLIKGGILEKPQLEGLYKLGLEYPDLCGSLFSVCRLPSST